jgi:hypothetical protein
VSAFPYTERFSLDVVAGFGRHVMPTLAYAMAGIYGCRSHPCVLPVPHKQHHPDCPDHHPQRHQHHESDVLGLMPEEHHAEPAAQSPAQTRHPQQRALRDAVASLMLRLCFLQTFISMLI